MLEMEKIADDAEIDTRCIVMRDSGRLVLSRTTSKPYRMGQDLVVQVMGIPGCYLASRVYDATYLLGEVIENCDYESLRREVCDQPTTWYSDLIRAMVEAAYEKQVFIPGGASRLIESVEKKIGKFGPPLTRLPGKGD